MQVMFKRFYMRRFFKDVPITSIIHLFLVRGSIYLFPFITLPIITRSFDVELFGVLSLFLAAQQYLVMIIEYGFTLTGARDIARVSEHAEETKILSEIMVCRAFLFLFCIPFIILAYAFLSDYNEYIWCYLILLLTVMSAVLNQTHFFIGKEKTGFIVIATSITRIISIMVVVLFVKSNADIPIAMLAYSMNVALPNIFSSIYIVFRLKYNFSKELSISAVYLRLKSSFDIFISNVFTNVYGTLTLMYLGSTKGAIEVGYYSSADKLKAAAQGAIAPIAQAFFPRIAKTRGDEFYRVWRKSTTIMVGFSVCVVTVLLCFSDLVYKVFLGEQYILGISIYYILLLSIISVSFGIAYAQNLYLTQGKTKLLRRIYFCVSMLHLFYMPIFVHFYGATGAALSVLLTESFASLLMFFFRKRCFTWSLN